MIDEQNWNKYEEIKLEQMKKDSEDELLFIIIKPIFFYCDNKFKCEYIRERKKKYEWINKFIQSISLIFSQKEEVEIKYGITIDYFNDYYENIKKDFINFIEEIEKIKTKIEFDLFEVAICFLCYLNNNNDFVKIISDMKKETLIHNLEIDNDILTKKNLYNTITEYCILYKIPIPPDDEYEEDEKVDKNKIIKEIKLLKCYEELCPITESYKNFILAICICLKESEDIRIKQDKKVVDFIELIFIILNIHLRYPDYWKEENLEKIISDIFQSSYKYCTDSLKENYIDFVISYITKYEISPDKFMNIFFQGLKKGELNKAFPKLNLIEEIGNINEEGTVKKLFDKLYIKKKKNPKSKHKNKKNKNKKDDIPKDDKNKDNGNIINENTDISKNKIKVQYDSIINEKNKEKEEESTIKINEKIIPNNKNIEIKNLEIQKEQKEKEENKNNKEEYKSNLEKKYEEMLLKMEEKYRQKEKENEFKFFNLQKKIDNLQIENKNMKEKMEGMKEKMEDLKEEIENLEREIDSLKNKNLKQDVEISFLKESCRSLSKDITRISYRDLSKEVLNDMIIFVNNKNNKLLKGINKRKDKLNKINNEFTFKDIEYMKNPFKEICNRYYGANIRSHVPDLAKKIKEQPVGFNQVPAEAILKNYCNVMIDSKNDQVIDFLTKELNIIGKIKNLYKL